MGSWPMVLVGLGLGLALHCERQEGVAANGEVSASPHADKPWGARQPLEQRGRRRRALRPIAIALRQDDLKVSTAPARNRDPRSSSCAEAPQQQRGTDEKHERQRHIGDQERFAATVRSTPSISARPLSAPRPSGARSLPGGRQTKRFPSRGKAERKESTDQRWRFKCRRDAARADYPNREDRQIAQQQSQRAAGHRHPAALGDHLRDKPAASGPECGANGYFFPRRCPDQKQVCQVPAGD